MQQDAQQFNPSQESAPIVEIYQPESNPNAPIQMERNLARNYAAKENNYPYSSESGKIEMQKPPLMPKPRHNNNDGENIFALA